MPRTQIHRQLAVNTPLGEDVLLLKRFTGREELGRVFEYELELLSERGDVDYDGLLGMPVSVRQEVKDDDTRYFHGIVTRIAQSPDAMLGDRRLAAYRATVSPWFWLLTRTNDCRIYQRQSVVDILKLVFSEFGFSDFELRLTENYTPRDFCVQYRESYFDFLSRLMEQEGIYYYFEHNEHHHTMVLCDSISAHHSVAGYERIPFKPQQKRVDTMERISRWTVQREVQPGMYIHADFDFKKPSVRLRHLRADPKPHKHSKYEFFDYPGCYVEGEHGDRFARIRQEEINARHETITGESDVKRLKVGMTFALTDHPRLDQNVEFLVSTATYRLSSDEFDTIAPDGKQEAAEPPVAIRFNTLRAATPFRSQRTTPSARVEGPQTAIVTGPINNPKEEIYTDTKGHGRVKVRFHWDRHWDEEGKPTEDSSCWVRVSQAWAGKGWGGLQIPRVGQEVIVDFIEGDPDRPLITGRVYNADIRAPQNLPASKAVSSMRSNSYPGGGGCNEISMDDTKGKEHLFVQAEYDKTVNVKHNRATTVGLDSTEKIGNNRTDRVGNDAVEEIVGNLSEHIAKNKAVVVDLNAQEKVGIAKVIDVGTTLMIKAGTSITLQCGASMLHMNQAGIITLTGTMITVGAAIDINIGAPIINIAAGMLLNTAGGLLNVQAGGLGIIDASGGFHKVMTAGDATVNAAGEVQVAGSKVGVAGKAETSIVGGMVKING